MIKFLGKYWKVLFALAILVAAYFFYQTNYVEKKAAYELETTQLQTYITSIEASIKENMRYAAVQDKLESANAAVDASRLKMYKQFPVEMKEEDQIMYVLYLETLFGTEINFSFSSPQAMGMLSEGTLMGMTLTVNYETTYDGFKDMINYLATDDRIVSVYNATIEYDAKRDKAIGDVTLLLYLIDSPLLDYASPDVKVPDTGKDSIFD